MDRFSLVQIGVFVVFFLGMLFLMPNSYVWGWSINGAHFFAQLVLLWKAKAISKWLKEPYDED